jgi:tRNA1(Val) A37 N6-methylase TrmN6
MLAGGAALTLIHRARALSEILAALEGRLGGIEVLPVRPRASAPAKRVLVRARKGSRAPLNLYAGFNLHDGSGAKFTAEAEAIFRGEALIEWR